MKDRGFTVSDPNELVGLAKAAANAVSGDSAQRAERDLAAADFECRDPHYGPMLLVAEEEWRQWIAENSEAVERVEQGWQDLIASARQVSG